MADHLDHVTCGKDFQYNFSVKNAKIISNMRSFLKFGVTYTKTKGILFVEMQVIQSGKIAMEYRG